MRGSVLLVLVLQVVVFGVQAQDSSRVAPKWVGDLTLGGGGSGQHITVKTGPEKSGTIDLAGWFGIGTGVEHRLAGRWSVRGSVVYELAGWEVVGANPFASPSDQGDRWAVCAGGVYQVYRGNRSQFTVHGGARLTLGMDVNTELQLDTLFTATSFQQVRLYYAPAVSPVLNVGWRWRTAKTLPLGVGVNMGVEYFNYTYDRADLSNGLSAFPTDLLPLTGTHAGWAMTWTFGLYGMF